MRRTVSACASTAVAIRFSAISTSRCDVFNGQSTSFYIISYWHNRCSPNSNYVIDVSVEPQLPGLFEYEDTHTTNTVRRRIRSVVQRRYYGLPLHICTYLEHDPSIRSTVSLNAVLGEMSLQDVTCSCRHSNVKSLPATFTATKDIMYHAYTDDHSHS